MLWMLNYVVDLHSLTPLCSSQNSKLTEPMQYTQKVQYLPQTNQSPTNHSVVAETLCRSLQIAQEARKNSIVVTYDLAIAKIVMQIQKEEFPVYDNILIALGSFHIEMAYFRLTVRSHHNQEDHSYFRNVNYLSSHFCQD